MFGGAVALDGADFAARTARFMLCSARTARGRARCANPDWRAPARLGALVIDGQPCAGSVRDGIARGSARYSRASLSPISGWLRTCSLGASPGLAGAVDRARRSVGPAISSASRSQREAPSPKVGSLPISHQQMSRSSRSSLASEGSSCLTTPRLRCPARLRLALCSVRRLTDEGAAAVFISHRIREAFEIADRITVFRNGRTVSSGPVSVYTGASLVEAMLGRRLVESTGRPPALTEEVALEIGASATGGAPDVNWLCVAARSSVSAVSMARASTTSSRASTDGTTRAAR